MKFTFDWNEWFMILSSIGALSIFFIIRKYFNPIINLVVWIFTIAFVESVDYFLAGGFFRWYYFGDNDSYEISTTLIHSTLYPAYSILFLYFYEKWNLNGKRLKLTLYILFWTGFSVFFEWICTLNHVLTYTGWRLFYSIPTYPISSLVLIKLFHFVKKNLHKPIPFNNPRN